MLALAILVSRLALSAPMQPLGAFEHHQDVGAPKLAGDAIYDPIAQTYTLSSAAPNAGTELEQFHLAWTKLEGDFIVQASVRFVGADTSARRQLGLMVLDSLVDGSRRAAAAVHADTLTALQYRATDGAATARVEVSSFHPTDIQIARTGNKLTLSSAVFGENYKSVSHDITLASGAYVGLFVASHEQGVVARAMFSNVRVIIPAAPGFKPYSDYLGSHLEVMDIATGQRRVLHSEPGSIQAPNWTRDDKLIYNSAAGVMYTYDIATGKVQELNTGAYRQNNNDHVLSFDGKMLALSNYAGQPRRSVAFILPVAGSSQPQQITSPEGDTRSSTAGHRTARSSSSPAAAEERPASFAISGRSTFRRRPRRRSHRPARSTTAPSTRPTASTSTSTHCARARCRSGACVPTAAIPSRSPSTSTTTGSPTSRPTVNGSSTSRSRLT